jgi:hypothetical protein
MTKRAGLARARVLVRAEWTIGSSSATCLSRTHLAPDDSRCRFNVFAVPAMHAPVSPPLTKQFMKYGVARASQLERCGHLSGHHAQMVVGMDQSGAC